MLPFTVESVYIVFESYGDTNTEANASSVEWLGKFRQSVEAWIITDAILTESRVYEATLFAAQTIRHKILYDFAELSSNQQTCESLRASMMNHLRTVGAKFADRSLRIVVQLALGLADLYLQMPQWNNLIGEMLQKSSQSTSVLLTMFTVFSEELYNQDLRIGANRRNAVELELAEKTPAFLQSLSHLCEVSPGDTALQKKVISCLAAWLLNAECPLQPIAESPLFQSVLYAMRLPHCADGVLDAASECVTNVLGLIITPEKSTQLVEILQAGIYECLDAVREHIAKENVDKLQIYTKIFCELAEALMPRIVCQPGTGFGDLRTLELILLVVDYHDYSLAEMTLNVWYRLSEYLFQAEDRDFDELRVVFRPYIERLMVSLYKHCRLEKDMTGMLNADSEIAQFREKAAESIKDVTFIIGTVDLIKCMTNLVNTSLANGCWDEVESALYVMSCIIHNIIETEDEVIPILLKTVFSLKPDQHVMLLSTASTLLGNLAHWLAHNTEYLQFSAQWLISLTGKNVVLLKTLALALEQVCEHGHRHLYQFFDTIYDMILSIENVPSDGQQMEASSHHLTRACAHLTNDLPAGEIVVRLERLCCRPIKFLTEIVSGQLNDNNLHNQENLPDSWRRLSGDPMLWLDRLSGIYRVLKPWNDERHNANGVVEAPWLALSTQVWRVVSATLNHFQDRQRIVEHACRTIRFIIRSIGPQSIVFVEELAQQMIVIYESHPHSCFLYLSSIVVDEYSMSSANVQDGLVALLNRLAVRSIALLQMENGFRQHPDTVDDLYRLAIRFVQRLPHKFFSQPVFETLFGGAIVGLEVEHVDANRSITKFIMETIDVARKCRINSPVDCSADARCMIEKFGDQLVWTVLKATVFHLPTPLHREMAEILHALSLYDKQRLAEWLTFAISNLPQNSGLSATTPQLEDFRNGVLTAKRSYSVGECLATLCRYYT